MSDEMPDYLPPTPPPKKGLSNGWIIALSIIALIVLVFGVCVIGAITNSGA